jgi:ribosomal protein L37AE/L43A
MTDSASIDKCPVCDSTKIRILDEHSAQCIKCRIVINSNIDNIKALKKNRECPLCGSKEITPLPSGNMICKGCNNSFVSYAIDFE